MAQSPILVTDEPPTELDIGKLIAVDLRRKRIERISKWVEDGHITVDANHTLNEYKVRIDQQYFAEPKDEFPSVGLIANIALAINAGQTDRKQAIISDWHSSDLLQYARLGTKAHRTMSWMEEVYGIDARAAAALRPAKKRAQVCP